MCVHIQEMEYMIHKHTPALLQTGDRSCVAHLQVLIQVAQHVDALLQEGHEELVQCNARHCVVLHLDVGILMPHSESLYLPFKFSAQRLRLVWQRFCIEEGQPCRNSDLPQQIRHSTLLFSVPKSPRARLGQP